MGKIVFIFLSIIFLSCTKEGKVAEDITQIDSTANALFIDRGQSSIVINNSGDSTRCYDVKSVQFKILHIAPDGEWANYIAKESSSTITCEGQEGQKRTIVVELKPADRPRHNAYVIRHEVDEINLEHDYYQTTLFGCCDAEPIYRIYDYEGNFLIEGYAKVIIGAIPNNSIKFFVGYSPSEEDSIIGSIHIAFDAARKYSVNIKSAMLPPDYCSQYTPAISLVSSNRYDTLDVVENEYQLWELENIESIDQISHLGIRVMYQCEVYFPVEPIIIPITRGRPFGKDASQQEIALVSKHTMQN